nr:unnamed protein product [Digitaria exilis]
MAHVIIFLIVAYLLTFLWNPIAILAAESTNRSELDRRGLLYFKQGLNDPLGVLSAWVSLDFCSWKGVTCGRTLPPRVVSLELNSVQLAGQLSQSLANLTSIVRLDLANNQLSGGIPDELGTLPKLQKREHIFPCYKETMKKVSYGDILKATNWLSPVNKISTSRTGSVYIGRFQFDTDLVVIKVFHLDEYGSLNSFLMECQVLRNTRHRNLMKAVTLCSTVDLENNEFKAIVFDFMANGSLDMWVHPKLHQNCPKRCLSLGQRIRIAADVASALDYMHNQLVPPLVHCDLKPSNVLLDYDMTARVGDYGSAKFISSDPSSPKEFVGVGGTIGYIAPEYGMGYKISTGCDVYSFGVLLLEMFTGMKPTDAMFTNGISLHKLVSSAYPHELCKVLDPYMSQEGNNVFATLTLQSYLMPLVEVALLCSMDLPKDRPGTRDVCAKILEISEAFLES